jgi:hypothetical protein
MHSEELERLNAKWFVWHCPWDNYNKTNKPNSTVSEGFETREKAQEYLDTNYPNAGYEYYVAQKNGKYGLY